MIYSREANMGKRKKIDLTREELRAMIFDEELNQSEIARRVGCAQRTIATYVTKWGLQQWPAKYEFDPEELRRMYEDEEMTTYEIAEHFGVSQYTIWVRVKDVCEMRERKPRPGVNEAENSPNWEGGYREVDGYRVVRLDKQEHREHRKIMENLIGRPLADGEVVHHIDCDRSNNDPSNLMLLSPSEHSRLHHAMRKDPELDQRAWIMRLRASEVYAA